MRSWWLSVARLVRILRKCAMQKPQGRFTRTLSRAVGWFLLIAIVALTLCPPNLRPSAPVPHVFEHAIIFIFAGFAFGIGYPGREFLVWFGAALFCGILELSQTLVPGRHARLSDLLIDLSAASAGIASTLVLSSILGRRTMSK